MRARSFSIKIPDDRLIHLKERLAATVWPGDYANADWHYGVEESWLRSMVDYWRGDFDWRLVEAEMNRLPHFQVAIEGIPIHFIHIRSGRPDSIPLILTHGWPWSFWDWRDVVSLLSRATEPSFDLVVPSLPGFTFSTPLRTHGIGVRRVGSLWRQLMQNVLGYDRFVAAGGDWGSMVSAELGHAHADIVAGVNLTLPILPGTELAALAHVKFAPEEQWMARRAAEAGPLIASHMAVQCNDPQTLAYALADSPVGLAAWLWERRLSWSDDAVEGPARGRDFLCALASLYWFTNSIGSSMRIYRDHFSQPWNSLHDRERIVDVPTGYIIAPKELAMFSRAMAEKSCNLRRWTILPRGGHFHAAETPDLVAEEYRTFFSRVWTGSYASDN
jgi:pimeloyl-ACP methyl ester carboxylesterase